MTTIPDTFIGFDLETTGVDPEKDRIVTAAVVEVLHGAVVRERTWLVNPGVEIPTAASRVHGISTDRALNEGMNPIRATSQITGQVWYALSNGIPLVAMNAPFDLTMLDRECRRYDVQPIEELLESSSEAVVLDPLVLDRFVDPYRPGKRTLESLAQYYRVPLSNAHEAYADALAAVHVTSAILAGYTDAHATHRTTRHDQVVGVDLARLHERQKSWHAVWAAEFEKWLRRTKNPQAQVPTAWPIHPHHQEQSLVA